MFQIFSEFFYILKGKRKMILKILILVMIGLSIFMYLVILGANKSKSKREFEYEIQEQENYVEKWRQENDGNNKKKRNLYSRFRTSNR